MDGDHPQSTYDRPHNEFICESIQPLEGFDTAAMSIGEPGFPKRFKWRDREYELGEIVERWKESGPCRNGANERYLRKHWFQIVTTNGIGMKIYFDRQVRSKSQRTKRWWLYTVKGSSAES